MLGELTLTAALGKRILTKDGGKFRPVTVAEPELFLRWLWRHYRTRTSTQQRPLMSKPAGEPYGSPEPTTFV